MEAETTDKNEAKPKSHTSRKTNPLKMKKIIYVLVCAVVLSSCTAMHEGYMTSSVALSSNNFSYVKKGISGSASVSYILGMGGLATDALVSDAKESMLSENPLKENQALVNLTVNFKHSSYFGLLYMETTCTVTADVVEFNK